MSDSELGLINQNLLEMLFNVKGYIARGIKQTSNKGKVIIEFEQTFDSRCPRCGKNCNESRYDSKYQEIYIGSIHCKSVYAKVKVWRVKCPDCGVLTDQQKISEGKRRYSKQVSKTVVKYTKLMDNESVSKLLGISPSTVYRIDKEELSKLMENYIDKIPEVYKASVDEVSRKRRHYYATIISDQIEGKVLWVEKGRTS